MHLPRQVFYLPFENKDWQGLPSEYIHTYQAWMMMMYS